MLPWRTHKEKGRFLQETPPKKKSLKIQEKKEKHATKIPSSRGRFIVDSSCFFVSGPRVKTKKGRGKEKRENSKNITLAREKKPREKTSKKEKKQEPKKTNHYSYFAKRRRIYIKKLKKTQKMHHIHTVQESHEIKQCTIRSVNTLPGW